MNKLKLLIDEKEKRQVHIAKRSMTAGAGESSLYCTWDRLFSRS